MINRDGATAFTVHRFRLDGNHERFKRALEQAERTVDLEQQQKFIRALRTQWVRDGGKPRGVRMTEALLASLARLESFEQFERTARAKAAL